MRIFLASIVLMSSVMAQADSDVTAVSDQASNMIQGYITQNPDVVSNIVQTQNQINDSINALSQLHLSDIASKINSTEPSHVILPTKSANINHDIPN